MPEPDALRRPVPAAEHAPDIGKKKIDGVEQARLASCGLERRHINIQRVPITSIITVSGAPTRK